MWQSSLSLHLDSYQRINTGNPSALLLRQPWPLHWGHLWESKTSLGSDFSHTPSTTALTSAAPAGMPLTPPWASRLDFTSEIICELHFFGQYNPSNHPFLLPSVPVDVFSALAFLFMTKISPTGSAQVLQSKREDCIFSLLLFRLITAVCRTAWHSHTMAFKSVLYTTKFLGQPEINPVSWSLVCHCCNGDKLGFQDSPYSKAAAERLAGDGEGIQPLRSTAGEAEVL